MDVISLTVSIPALVISGAAYVRTIVRERETLDVRLMSGGNARSPNLVFVEVQRYGRPAVLNNLRLFDGEGQTIGWHGAQPEDMLLMDADKVPPEIIAQFVQQMRELHGLGVVPPPILKPTLADGQLIHYALVVEARNDPQEVFCTIESSRSPKLATSNRTFVNFPPPLGPTT